MIQLSSSLNRICVDIERENIPKETKIDKEELFIFTDQPEYNSWRPFILDQKIEKVLYFSKYYGIYLYVEQYSDQFIKFNSLGNSREKKNFRILKLYFKKFNGDPQDPQDSTK